MRVRTLQIICLIELSLLSLFIFLHIFDKFTSYPNNWFISIAFSGIILLVGLLLILFLYQKVERNRIENILPPSESDEKIIYQNQQDELRFIKTLQWNFIYYLLLIFGALFVLSQIARTAIDNSKYLLISNLILFSISFVFFDYGIFFICETQYKLRNIRIEITKSRFYKHQFETELGLDEKTFKYEKASDKRFWHDSRFTGIFITTSAFSLLIISLRLIVG